jgi:Tol biopolymer transport system component
MRRRAGLTRRALVASGAVVVFATGCTSFAAGAGCADPLLVTSSGHPQDGGVFLHLWADDGEQEVLTDAPVDGGRNGGAVVSPDGTTVAFPLGEGEYSDSFGYPQTRVALLSIETEEVRLLSSDVPGATVLHPHWSADGSQIAFLRHLADAREIVAVDVADGTERTLLSFDDDERELGSFAWSSDGQELLVPTRPLTPVGPVELWRYSVDTGDHEVVAMPHSSIEDVAWSPGERLVAMQADIPGTGRPRLFVLDLEAGTSTPVDRRRGGPQGLTWSGPHLLYTYSVTVPDDAVYPMRWDSRSQERARVDRPDRNDVLSQFGTISAPVCDR